MENKEKNSDLQLILTALDAMQQHTIQFGKSKIIKELLTADGDLSKTMVLTTHKADICQIKEKDIRKIINIYKKSNKKIKKIIGEIKQ